MCGISGLVSRYPIGDPARAAIRRVNDALTHRGPDGQGEFAPESAPHNHIHLAMRRLAIIDLHGGWQPLYNEDKSIILVANGEVYNYLELQADLKARGHQYRTGSDCESIIHAYEEFGEDFVHKLRGMYAFALYDTRKHKVILGRDRMGEKPLYLYERDGEIWFASELRSLMSSRVIPFELDPAAINQYFHYSFVPEPMTPIVGIRKLPAGHTLTIDLSPISGGWAVQQTCYWRLEDAPPIDADPVQTIRNELETIAELITRADVPVGVALSAGIDSSAIAALVARKRPGQIHALSVGYPGRPRQDERSTAHRFAQTLNMPFHETEVGVREFVELFAERALWRDDPIADPAGHSYFAVSRLAREKNIPVLLMGQGGDELFWGYNWTQDAVRLSELKQAGTLNSLPQRLKRLRARLPASLRSSDLRACALHNLGYWYGYRRSNPDQGQPADRLIYYNNSVEYQVGAFGTPLLLAPSFLERANRGQHPGDIFSRPLPWGDIGVAISSLSCATYLRENGMVQGDRLSMANSVELRLPFSDYRFAEIAVGLRKVHPDHALAPKAHLKAAVSQLLPDWVMNRPKTGFTPPSKTWMPALTAAYHDSLTEGYLVSKGVLNPECCARFQRVHSRHSPWTDLFYRSLVLEFWARGMDAATSGLRSHHFRVPTAA